MEDKRLSLDGTTQYDASAGSLESPTTTVYGDNLVASSVNSHVSQNSMPRDIRSSRRKATFISVIITFLVVGLSGAAVLLQSRQSEPNNPSALSSIPTQDDKLRDAASNIVAPEFEGAKESLLVDGDIISRGALKLTSGSYLSVLRVQDLKANQAYSLPNASGTFCLDSNNCGYTGLAQFNDLNQRLSPLPGRQAALQAQINNLQGRLGQIATPTVPPSSLVNNQAGAVSIQGTSNQISVTTSGGVITLASPQDLAPLSSPSFASLILSGNFSVNGTIKLPINCSTSANGGALTTNGSGQVICSDDDGGAGSAIGGSGTAGAIPMFTAAQTIANSIISQALGTITVSGDLAVSGNLSASTLTLAAPLTVPNGGTGATSFTANGLLLGNGAGAIGSTGAPVSGQLLLGNGTTPTFTTVSGDVLITGAGVTTIQANSVALGVDTTGNYVDSVVAGNGINVSGAAGEGSSPTISVVYGSTVNTAVQGNTVLTCASGTGNLTGGGNNITLGTGGTCGALSVINSPTFSGTLVVQGATVTVGTAVQQGSLILNDGSSNTGTVQTAPLGQNTVYTLPDPGGAGATFCLSSGNCAGVGGTGNVLQGGNSFGTALTLGTNDNFAFNLETNGITRVSIGNTGLLNFGAYNCSTFANGGALTTDAFGNVVC
ncbi:MAG: beta strand repeat-containing protein, partial [Candidatus Saccharimonadales bacterium]